MDTTSLDKAKKETPRQWMEGHIVRDVQENPINHRIWVKNIFNPFLRFMGWVINANDNGNVIGYKAKKYNKD